MGASKIAALPTTYNGVNYRSMLEARYAAWFGLMGIEAHYEPEALAGYIPDFMVRPAYCDSYGEEAVYYAEDECGTEDAFFCSELILVEIKGLLSAYDHAKVRRSGWRGVVVVLDGRGPRHGYTPGGVTYDIFRDGSGCYGDWSQLMRGRVCHQKTNYDAAWREAGNLIQWRGRGQL